MKLLRSSVELVEMSPEYEPEAATQRAEVLNYVGLALDQLPENQATALDMKYIGGFSSQQICRAPRRQ